MESGPELQIRSGALTARQGSCFLQQMAINTDREQVNMQRLRHFGVLIPKWASIAHFTHTSSGVYAEEGAGRMQEPEVVDDFTEAVRSRHQTDVCKSSRDHGKHTQDLYMLNPGKSQHREQSGGKNPTAT